MKFMVTVPKDLLEEIKTHKEGIMDYLYIQAARNEFHWLTNKIVHDGRDPFFVAEAMLEKLVKSIQKYQDLWDSTKEG